MLWLITFDRNTRVAYNGVLREASAVVAELIFGTIGLDAHATYTPSMMIRVYRVLFEGEVFAQEVKPFRMVIEPSHIVSMSEQFDRV